MSLPQPPRWQQPFALDFSRWPTIPWKKLDATVSKILHDPDARISPVHSLLHAISYDFAKNHVPEKTTREFLQLWCNNRFARAKMSTQVTWAYRAAAYEHKHQQIVVPADVYEVLATRNAVMLFEHLWITGHTGNAFEVSRSELIEQTGLCKSNLKRAMLELEAKKYLIRVVQGGSQVTGTRAKTVYRFLSNEERAALSN
jgi:hypothetical protein